MRAAYEQIQAAVRQDPLHTAAQARRQELGPLYEEYREEFLESTVREGAPKHRVAVAAFVTNAVGEVLLVRTDWRADTWELPGGQVEAGESLMEAARREVLEEAGVDVRLSGVTGVYQNLGRGILTVVFRGEAIGGAPRPSAETPEVAFVQLNEANLSQWVTRPHVQSRVLDALRGEMIPCQWFSLGPYRAGERVEGRR
jgi:8-oxo-dGTP diphosphatase